MGKRILFIQYAGDYRAAYQRLQTQGNELYSGHSMVLSVLAELAGQNDEVGILCANSDDVHDETLPTGVRVIGLGGVRRWEWWRVVARIAAFKPTHLVVLGPLTGLLRWGVRHRIQVLPVFADSFEIHPLRRLVRYGQLASVLDDPYIRFVGNHGVGACLSLARLGVDRRKIVPYDFPQRRSPAGNAVKQSPAEGDGSIFYAGLVSEAKGVGDAVRAVGVLAKQGLVVKLQVAGRGDIDSFRRLAGDLGVADRVEFLGPVPNDQVVRSMREATVVAIPSRHSYPEGFPLTIYEALSARTPIVASDHPMFVRRLHDRQNARMFRAGDAAEFASAIHDLFTDADLYRTLSANAEATWQTLQVPMKWGPLITDWLAETPEASARIAEHSLASERYRDEE